MLIRLSRCLLVACALGTGGPAALAQAADPSARPPRACAEPEYAGHPLLQREERIAQYEGLGEQCLKRLALECNAAASRHLLDAGSAFACSLGYEALLRRGFGGDFQAMLAWWRTRPTAGSLD